MYTEIGFDQYVTAAINDVAGGAPDPAPELLTAAERAFAGQLDGSNAERQQREMMERFGLL